MRTVEEAKKSLAQGITWKVRRALLRYKWGFSEILIDELVGKTEPASDY